MPSPLILASASPRRRQLLEQLGLAFVIAEQDIDESRRSGEPALDYVQRMAREKAASALISQKSDAIVIAADTSVICDDEVLGKPVDERDALRMLRQLSGREHTVLSAVVVARGGEQHATVSASIVRFRQISDGEAAAYWRTGEPLGKAGGYAIQGYGAVFVQQLQGSYSGVMGLPLFETAALLQEFGISCLPVEAAHA